MCDAKTRRLPKKVPANFLASTFLLIKILTVLNQKTLKFHYEFLVFKL
jgi:hypothetical protein